MDDVQIKAQYVYNSDVVKFLTMLQLGFQDRIQECRDRRAMRNLVGPPYDFLKSTEWIRKGDWKVAPPPRDLVCRTVEITGPASDAKMFINALNSGADVFMADLEDSMSPTFENVINAQRNLQLFVQGKLELDVGDRQYRVCPKPATLFVRPRGLHMDEADMAVDNVPIPASLYDFGLYAFHNARELLAQGKGVYLYLPKMESHHEAKLWNDIFIFTEGFLELPVGTIRATCLIETLPAAFEMDEILYELRDHSAGLNCGRWDYIFSFIKKMDAAGQVLAPRSLLTMDRPFLEAYAKLLIQTCHKRGAHAIGGMSAYIPVKNDTIANDHAMRVVRSDKKREAILGHDGTWVAHPGLVQLAREVFCEESKEANQIERQLELFDISAEDLLRPVQFGAITERDLYDNIYVSIVYIEAWLRGQGAVAIRGLMEDAATAEISRTQVWQWLKHETWCSFQDDIMSRRLTKEDVSKMISRCAVDAAILSPLPHGGLFVYAADIFEGLVMAPECPEFLTTAAYPKLLEIEEANAAKESQSA